MESRDIQKTIASTYCRYSPLDTPIPISTRPRLEAQKAPLPHFRKCPPHPILRLFAYLVFSKAIERLLCRDLIHKPHLLEVGELVDVRDELVVVVLVPSGQIVEPDVENVPPGVVGEEAELKDV